MYGPLLEALESGATVVTANNRLARNLTHAYSRARQSEGLYAWASPGILSWQAWTAQLWAESEMFGGVAAAKRLLGETDVLVIWEQIAAGDPGLDAESVRSAALANKAWKLLCDWNAVAAPEWVEAGLSADQQAFLRWMGRFRDRCAAEGWVDTAVLSAVLIDDVQAGLFDHLGPLVFAGFDAWTPAQESLRDGLLTRGIALTLAEDQPESQSGARRIECLSDADELEQAARWARAQLEAGPELDVCVIVPDLQARSAEARRVFMDVFCPDWRTREGVSLPVNFSYGEALASRPRVAAALNLLHIATGSEDYRHFSLALRTPFVAAGREESGARALLDIRLRERFGAEFSIQDAVSLSKEPAPAFAAMLGALQNAANDTSERTLTEWADWIAGLLREAQWPGSEALDSIAFQELEAWHALLRDFAGGSKVQGSCSVSQALGLLQRVAQARVYQPETGRGVVQVMGMLEASGHQFHRLWVTGMAAEDWPPDARPSPLIPYGLQRSCGMPGSSPGKDLDYAVALTERLKVSAPNCIFSWPGMRDGEHLRPSELIMDVQLASSIDAWSEPLWPQAMLGSADIEEMSDDRPVRWPEGERAPGGAYLFNLQASCPLRAFLELRLGAKEVDDPVIGIGYKERGSLAHRVLEDFYRKFDGSAALAELDVGTIADELNELMAQHMHKLPGMRRRFMRTLADLETQRLLPLLINFVALDKARTSFTVAEAEQEREVKAGPISVGLKLDRMDQLENGALLVVDYKTGSKVERKSWNPVRPSDMQLPLYATFTGMEIAGIAFAQVAAQDVKYEGLADDAIAIDGILQPAKMRTQSKFTDSSGAKLETWDELTHAWRECLLELAEGFATGDCSINPKQTAKAEGQFAVLTRVYDLPGADAGENDNDG